LRLGLQELDFSYVEMNASCTRSKNSLKEVVSESLNNTSIENFYKGDSFFNLCFCPLTVSDAPKLKRCDASEQMSGYLSSLQKTQSVTRLLFF